MAQIDLGKLKFQWKGAWQSSTAYETDDVVEFEGSTFVVVANVPSNNVTNPKGSSLFEFMTVGLDFKGTFSSTTSYQKGDVVNYNNAVYVLIFAGGYNQNITVPPAPAPDTSSKWQIMTPAPAASVLTTSGDLITKDKDDTTTKRLPIGVVGSQLTVEADPDESVATDSNTHYVPTAFNNVRVAQLYADDSPAATAVSYTVTVAAVSGQNQFHLNGTDRLGITLKAGSTYTFDVSDSSNTGHVLKFYITIGGTDYEVTDGYSSSGTAGSSGATVTFVPPKYIASITKYKCSVHSAMGHGVVTGQGPTVVRQNFTGANTNIKLVRGRSYNFSFPANGLTYSIKDPAAGGYSGAGSGGRLTAGLSPASITNGGSIKFSPSAATPDTVVIRDEANQSDLITITVKNMSFGAVWKGGSTEGYDNVVAPLSANIVPPKHNFPNQDRNVYTESILPVPAYLKNSGRGYKYGHVIQGYRQGGIITEGGNYFQWGNGYNDANGYTYGGGAGYGMNPNNVSAYALMSQYRMPLWWKKCLAGDPTYAKFLTDFNGNDLGYRNADGSTNVTKPKVIQIHKNLTKGYHLLENGICMFSGYGNDGGKGDGTTNNKQYAVVPMTFYDESNTQLTGANEPKITQVFASVGHTGDSTTYDFNGFQMFLDTEGNVYRFGYNAYGQLGDGSTTANYYAKRYAASTFNNEKIIYITGTGYQHNSAFFITESGKLWGTGRNAHGSLGIGNTTQQTSPVEITAVAGSPIQNKKIVHVVCNQGDEDNGSTWFLTDEGKVYYAGYKEGHGVNSGVYQTSESNNVTTPTLLTNSNTLWNSDSQKVVYIACSNTENSTIWLITDGGTTGLPQKIYATGFNSTGQQGTNTSITSGASASAQGNWFGGEIKFRDFGDYESSSGTGNRPNEGTDMTWASITQVGGANYQKFPMGKIVDIIPVQYSDETSARVCMLDEFGNMFMAGSMAIPIMYDFEDDNADDMEGTQTYVTSFVPMFHQPEQLTPYGFCWTGSGDTQRGWQIITKGGNFYTGGYNSWNQAGSLRGQVAGFSKPHLAFGGY